VESRPPHGVALGYCSLGLGANARRRSRLPRRYEPQGDRRNPLTEGLTRTARRSAPSNGPDRRRAHVQGRRVRIAVHERYACCENLATGARRMSSSRFARAARGPPHGVGSARSVLRSWGPYQRRVLTSSATLPRTRLCRSRLRWHRTFRVRRGIGNVVRGASLPLPSPTDTPVCVALARTRKVCVEPKTGRRARPARTRFYSAGGALVEELHSPLEHPTGESHES
jgi:hypothetical protein